MKTSEIEWEAGLVQRLLFFQSMRQFASFSAVVALVLVGAYSFILLTGLKGDIGSIAIPAVVIALYSVRITLPQRFFVAGHDVNALNIIIEGDIERMGYQLAGSGSGFLYISKLPKVLSWDENRIVLTASPQGIKVIAPRLVVKRIHNIINSI